ncbi:MAG: hypothetical protein M3464_03545 [Chloroflexota bacterium]|nr:hypothetical protein [Chloroflexota bacterium]
MRRRVLLSGLGLSLSLAGARAVPAMAQDTTVSFPPTGVADLSEWEAERAARYEEFLARFTDNLGLSDPELVETAFKETLKEMIDDRLAAGEISANLAEDLKTRIDEAEGPILIGHLMRGGHVMHGGPDGNHSDVVRLRPRAGDRLPIENRHRERELSDDDDEDDE